MISLSHQTLQTLPLLFSKSAHQQTLLLFVVIQITKMFYLLVFGFVLQLSPTTNE